MYSYAGYCFGLALSGGSVGERLPDLSSPALISAVPTIPIVHGLRSSRRDFQTGELWLILINIKKE